MRRSEGWSWKLVLYFAHQIWEAPVKDRILTGRAKQYFTCHSRERPGHLMVTSVGSSISLTYFPVLFMVLKDWQTRKKERWRGSSEIVLSKVSGRPPVLPLEYTPFTECFLFCSGPILSEGIVDPAHWKTMYAIICTGRLVYSSFCSLTSAGPIIPWFSWGVCCTNAQWTKMCCDYHVSPRKVMQGH